jgi:hypothetical protein
MSAMYSGRDVVQLLATQKAEAEAALGAAESAKRRHARVRSELEEQIKQANNDLGVAILPTLDAASVARAVHLTGYTPFQHQDPVTAREQERHAIAAQLQTIASNPAYANRELLRHPRTGSLNVRREELLGHRKPWAEVLEAADHPRLDRLLEVQYGTDAYAVPFWRLSYYQDWEAADEILAKFPGKATFGEVRDEIAQARETVATFDSELADVARQMAEGSALDHQYSHLYAQYQSVDERHLAGARKRLVEHLITMEAKWITPRLQADANVQGLYLRASGLVAKAKYLDAMVEEHAGKLYEQLAPQVQKLERDIQKFSRPKNYHAWWPRDVIDRRVKSRRDRFAKQQQKFETHYTTVYVYDDWNRARGHDDFVWWYLMTDNRFGGSYIPEVAAFEQSHPDWSRHVPEPDYDDSDAAAAIASESDATAASYGVDAS